MGSITPGMGTASRFFAALATAACMGLAGCSLLPSGSSSSASTAASPGPVEPLVVAPARLELAVPEIEALPETPTDVLARLRSSFELPVTDDANVVAELEWYGSHADYIARVFTRGERYLHYIAGELEARGMPADLALLPVVESAFDPFAYSRGRASGLWQIIPGTGERLGLKQNWWYDGRRDVVDSTRAALDYLELLHEQFDGDWLLAVAGYNSGEGNVARAIRRAEAAGRPTDFWSIRDDLPPETARYVPRLLAIRDLVADPARFAIELPVIANEPYFAAVETGSQIDLALAATLSGIEIDALYALNPGINRWATDPEGPHRLLVPATDVARFEIALGTLGPDERVRWTRHEIRRGETLGEIAEDYDTTSAVLREINGLAGNTIRAGAFLMVPHASAGEDTYSLSLEARIATQQGRERSGTRIDYAVKAGDSLWSIAELYDVGTAELASWNAMAPGDVLSVGRTLVVWTESGLAAALSGLSGPGQIRQINYVVRSGDSLSAIAGRFRVSLADLLEWNGLAPDRYLQPGQSLVLYVDVTEQSS